jgi:flagellar motor switch protein FliN/FliY
MGTVNADVVEQLAQAHEQILGTASSAFVEATGTQVHFGHAEVSTSSPAEIEAALASPHLYVTFGFSENPEARQAVYLSAELATSLAAGILGEPPTEFDESVVAELKPGLEAIAQGIAMAVSGLRGHPIAVDSIEARFGASKLPQNLKAPTEVLRVAFEVQGEGTSGSGFWVLDGAAAEHIFDGKPAETAPAFGELHVEEGGVSASRQSFEREQPGQIDLLLDIPLEISVELGRVRMLIKDVVDLGTGSIVEIDKAAGEPVDVLVNGRLVAKGEVVVIEDNFGVRITEIITPQERLTRLSEAA